jgi:hypothetical protein
VHENNVEEPEQTAPPPVPSRHGLPAQAHPRQPDEGEEDAAADERTSPFPYAEKFDEWVADETAASDERRDRRDAGSPDAAP